MSQTDSEAKSISHADYDALDRKLIRELKRRIQKARTFPTNTCPASRHVQIMGECLASRGYPMLQEEPLHCAVSLLSTVASLYEARSRVAEHEAARIEATRQHATESTVAGVDAGIADALNRKESL